VSIHTTKSSPASIAARFDQLVDEFSDRQGGQRTAIDSALCLDLIAQAARACTPDAKALLDIGCGAGNYSLALLESLPGMDVTLLDLSGAMLERAAKRVGAATTGQIRTVQQDVREADLGEAGFDVIVAAAVFHHLRGEAEWDAVFAKLYRALRPGGCLWIYDLVEHELPAVSSLMWARYRDFLESLGGAEYRQTVFDYIEEEDTPRPLSWQLDRLRAAGFGRVDILHKHGNFAAFGGVKPKATRRSSPA